MKIIVSAALVAAQLSVAAQPAFAAEIQRETAAATGTFGGLRLRVPLDGRQGERAPSLGLAFAPTVHTMGEDGAVRMQMGEGVEFGFGGRRQALALSVAGRRLGAAQESQDGEQEEDDGTDLDTGEAIAIGVGAIVIVGLAGFAYLLSNIEGE